MSAVLQRQHFSISRAAEYFKLTELQAQTGQPVDQLLHAVLKELIDNSLDAAETAGIAPDVAIEFQNMGKDRIRLAIADNGPGIPPHVVERLLDFTTRTSDKAAYRAATRSSQGNGIKTVMGIPISLGDDCGHLRIEAAGIIHDIEIWITQAGEVKHRHTQAPAETTGTRIETIIPPYVYGMEWHPARWVFAYALFNPHAQLQIRELPPVIDRGQSQDDDFLDLSFSPSVAFPEDRWRKFLPTDTTPAGWYTPAEFATLVHLKAAVQPDQPLGDFIREFRGLSRTWREASKAVAVKTVGQLTDTPLTIPTLHRAMQAAAALPKPDILGRAGPDHFRQRLDERYTIKSERYWYKHRFGEANGMPYLIEVAIAETETGSAEPFYGLNFSVPFTDPLGSTLLRYSDIRNYGAQAFLRERDVYNGTWRGRTLNTAVALHLVMPLLPALDRGKSHLAISSDLADVVAEVLAAASKPLAEEWERWQRNQARESREQDEKERQHRAGLMDKKDAARSVMLPVYLQATDNEQLYVSARDYWYELRPPYQKLEVRPSKRNGGESAELDFGCFSQTILPSYRREVHPLTRIDYKARGILYEPHTGTETPIGDKELQDWEFPLWQFNKILFIEKEGVWETLKQTGGLELAKRYDMAIASCSGYAIEATRRLMAMAQQNEGYQIFVWHDADSYGYNICRTLAQETARMPNHRIQVFDLGLKLEEALDMGLQTETFDRAMALPVTLTPLLSETERRLFEDRKSQIGLNKWIWKDYQRVEINAIPVKDRVAYLDCQLTKIEGLFPKVKPPDSELVKRAERRLMEIIEKRTRAEAESRLKIDTIVEDALKRIGTPFTFDEGRISQGIDEQYERRLELSWRECLDYHIQWRLDAERVDIAAVTATMDTVIKGGRS